MKLKDAMQKLDDATAQLARHGQEVASARARAAEAAAVVDSHSDAAAAEMAKLAAALKIKADNALAAARDAGAALAIAVERHKMAARNVKACAQKLQDSIPGFVAGATGAVLKSESNGHGGDQAEVAQ